MALPPALEEPLAVEVGVELVHAASSAASDPNDAAPAPVIPARRRNSRLLISLLPMTPPCLLEPAQGNQAHHLVREVRGQRRGDAGRVVARDDLDDVEAHEVDAGEAAHQ